VQYPATRFKPRIWRNLLTLSLLSSLLPVGLLSLVWIIADTGRGAGSPVDIAQFDSAVDIQLDSTVTSHAQRINSKLGETEIAVVQMQALAQQVFSLPDVFAGKLPDSIPFLHPAPEKPQAGDTGAAAAQKQDKPASAGPPPAEDHPLDNPVYYSLSGGGALRKPIDDGHSAVFMMARAMGASFTRHDVQRLFASATLDPLLAETAATAGPKSQAYMLTSDSLLRAYPYIDLGTFDDAKDLTGLPIYAWSKAKANSRGVVWAGPYISRFSNTWVVACIADINVGGQMLGVVGAELPLSEFRERLLGFSLGRNGAAWLMDPSGLMIACQEQAPAVTGMAEIADGGIPDDKNPAEDIKAKSTLHKDSNAELFGQIQSSQENAAGTSTHKEGVFVRCAKLENTGWTLCGYLPSQLVEEGYEAAAAGDSQMRRMLGWIFCVLVIAVMLGFGVSWLEARRLSQPLAILTQQVRQAAISQTATSLLIADDSEIGALAAAVQELVDQYTQPATPASPSAPSRLGMFDNRPEPPVGE
jgi:hypothetical protein